MFASVFVFVHKFTVSKIASFMTQCHCSLEGIVFWNISPCSPFQINQRFGRNDRLLLQVRSCLPPAFSLVSWSVCSTLKREALDYSDMSLDFQQTTWRYILEDNNLHDRRCEIVTSYLKLKLNSVVLVRKRTIPTERPPFVGEVSANFCG
jgi:hypothetical protein